MVHSWFTCGSVVCVVVVPLWFSYDTVGFLLWFSCGSDLVHRCMVVVHMVVA